MFLDDRGGVRDGVGTRQLLFVVFNFSVLRWWGGGGVGVEGGTTGHILVAILDGSGYEIITSMDLIGMFFCWGGGLH